MKKKLILTIMASTFFLNVGAMDQTNLVPSSTALTESVRVSVPEIEGYVSDSETLGKASGSLSNRTAYTRDDGMLSMMDKTHWSNVVRSDHEGVLILRDQNVTSFFQEVLKTAIFGIAAGLDEVTYRSNHVEILKGFKCGVISGITHAATTKLHHGGIVISCLITTGADLIIEGPSATLQISRGFAEKLAIDLVNDVTFGATSMINRATSMISRVNIVWGRIVDYYMPNWLKIAAKKTVDFVSDHTPECVKENVKAAVAGTGNFVASLPERVKAACKPTANKAGKHNLRNTYVSKNGKVVTFLNKPVSREALAALKRHRRVYKDKDGDVCVRGESAMAAKMRKKHLSRLNKNIRGQLEFYGMRAGVKKSIPAGVKKIIGF